MVEIPFKTIPSISNIVRGEGTEKLFDDDFNTVYNPTTPSWSSMLVPLITDILVDTKYSSCVIRQMQYNQQTGADLGTKLYFILKTGERKLVYEFHGQGGYQPGSWQTVDIPIDAQAEVVRVQFEALGGGPAYPSAIKFLGDTPVAKQVVLKTRAKSPLQNLLGFVCYPWNTYMSEWPAAKDAFISLQPARIRVYDDVPNVFENGEVHLHWDQFNQYNTLKGMGVDVKDCLQNDPWYPYALGPSRHDPATYLNYATLVTKYAVANKAAGNPTKRIGLGNEEDRSWKSVEEYMDGYALAAKMSAGYDGHKGTLPGVGIKQADANVLVVSNGCATDKTQILHQMRLWVEEHRGYRANGSHDFPFDIYEFHWYQSVGGQYAGKPGGMPVEIVIDRVQEIVDFFREYCPEMKIEIGEYGLDFNQYSDLNAPAYGKYTAQQTRGNWFVRDLMFFAKLGIDGSDWYRELMDWVDDPSDPTGGTNIYDQSGMFFDTMDLIVSSRYAQPVTYKRRIVGDYFRQIGEVLRMGFEFDSVVSTDPYVFKFKKADANLYVLWTLETITWPVSKVKNGSNQEQGEAMMKRWKEGMSNKGKAHDKKNFKLSKPLKAIPRATFTEVVKTYTLNAKGTLMRFVDGADAMSKETFNGGALTVEAKPIMVIEPIGSTPPPPPPPPTGKTVVKKFTTSSGTIVLYSDGTYSATPKVIYKKYYAGSFYFVVYTDGTWVQTDSQWKPY